MWARLPYCSSKGSLEREYLDICLTTFSDSLISDIKNLLGSTIFKKFSKFNHVIKNAEKTWENVSYLWDNIIWIGIFNLSLLRTGYFPSAANVLTRCPKTWHVKKRNFFQLNYLGSYQ